MQREGGLGAICKGWEGLGAEARELRRDYVMQGREGVREGGQGAMEHFYTHFHWGSLLPVAAITELVFRVRLSGGVLAAVGLD